jgi:ribose 5-phosphate isomerase B
VDLGVDLPEPRVDYPDKAREVGEAIRSGRADRAVLVCGSGVGASVAACKLDGIRAAICHDVYSAHQGVEHDDMNVLCLGSGVVGADLAAELVRAFLAAEFDGGERYVRRLEKVAAFERDGGGHGPARDISVPIHPEMHVYEGNPGVRVERHMSIAEGADANVSLLELGVHSGTHVDAPLHFLDGHPGVETLSLLWERDAFTHDFVRLDGTGARFLLDRGVDLVGIDYLSIGDADAHRELLGADVTVVEGLDLREIEPGQYELVCLPLRLEGADGAPARAVLLPR